VIRSLLADPDSRRALVLTKVAVVVLTGLLTAVLQQWLGPRVWTGYWLFVLLLAVITAVVLWMTRPPVISVETLDDEEPEPCDASQPVVLLIEDSIDLHSFPPAEVPDVVAEYLEQARTAGFGEVRVIHGRGVGVQRERVRSLLARHPLVISYRDAEPQRGGWGATVVRLLGEDEGAGPLEE